MNNFDIKKYLIEGRLFEEKDPTGLTTKFSQYNPLVDVGGLRNQVRFLTFRDLPNKVFEAAKQHLIDQGYEIDEDQSYSEFEEDDDRYIYPRIIFRSKKINEGVTGGRIGTINISAKDLISTMEEIKAMGIEVDRFDGPSPDGKTNLEFHVYADTRDKPKNAFSVYDYKFGFDPTDEEHFMNEYPFSIGGFGNVARVNASNYLPDAEINIVRKNIREQMDIYDEIANMEFGMDYDQLGPGEKEFVRDEIDNMSMKENQTDDPRIDDSKFGPSPREFAELRAQMGDEALLDKIQMINVNTLSELLDELDLVRENKTYTSNKVNVNEGDLDEASKRYGEKFPMDKFKSLKGKEILISGFPYEVLSSDEYGLEVKGKDGNIRKINYNMFTQMGYVREVVNNIKKKLQEKKVKQDPDIKGRKGTQPAKYYKGLSKSTKLKRAKQFEKQTKKSEDDPSAYKKAPGDTAKTKPSKYTKKFKEKFGENILKEESKVDKSLKSKAKKANAPLSALRAIYNKGVAAWRTGHRPGATKEQWGLARVNSVLTGGKARKVDKVQWKQIQDYRKKKKK